MLRPVSCFPSRPPRRESFTPNATSVVDRRLAHRGVFIGRANVSATVVAETRHGHDVARDALSSGDRTPCDVNIFVTRPIRVAVAAERQRLDPIANLTLPPPRDPSHRPTSAGSIIDTSILNGSSGDPGGEGTPGGGHRGEAHGAAALGARAARVLEVETGDASARGVDGGEIELLVVRAHGREEVVVCSPPRRICRR